MTARLNEQLSALVDGELDAGEARLLVRRLSSDPELRTAWERYHRCGELLEEAVDAPVGVDIAEQVSEAIREEDIPEPPERRLPDWMRPAAGVAVAATVATFAVLGLQDPGDGDATADSELITVVPGSEPGSSWGASTDWIEPRHASGGDRESGTSQRLSTYLINHTDHSAGIVRDSGQEPAVDAEVEDEEQPE